MKNFLIVLFMLLLNIPCFAIQSENNDIWKNVEEVKQEENIQTSFWDEESLKAVPYLKYYDIKEFYEDGYDININFHIYTREEYKNLSKEEKKDYNKHKGLFKKISKGDYYYVTQFDPYYIPYLIQVYKSAKNNKQYKEEQNYLTILAHYCKYKIFDYDLISYGLNYLYWINEDWSKAIVASEYLRGKYYKTNNDIDDYYYFLTSVLAESYYNKGNYDKAIQESLKIKTSYALYQNGIIPEVLYLSYYKKKDYKNAFRITQSVIPHNYTYIWLSRAIETAPNDKIKISYLNKILDGYFKDTEKYIAYNELISIKDGQIKKAAKTINGYFMPPLWVEIHKERKNYITIAEAISQQRDFYIQIDKCINSYTGYNLKSALSDIKQKEEKATSKIIEDARYKQARLLELQRINQLQQMNANMNYQNSLIQNQNNLIQQQNYQLSRPRYTNTTITPIGNTYYMNSYSY